MLAVSIDSDMPIELMGMKIKPYVKEERMDLRSALCAPG